MALRRFANAYTMIISWKSPKLSLNQPSTNNLSRRSDFVSEINVFG
jgi:hypothetical protein